MASNFGGDTNCVALWRFENGALTTDNKSTNTLTAAFTPVADTSDYQEGAACVDLEASDGDSFYCNDTDLCEGFPLRNADVAPSLTFSMCVWVKPEAPLTESATICTKDGGAGGLWVRIGADGKLEFYTYSGGWQLAEFGTGMTAGQWYHVGLTHDSSDKSYRIRIWDKDAAALLGADVTGNFAGAISKVNAAFRIGGSVIGTPWDGKLDEFVVFKDVLTTDEIDAIRGGTYSIPGSGGYSGRVGRGIGRGVMR